MVLPILVALAARPGRWFARNAAESGSLGVKCGNSALPRGTMYCTDPCASPDHAGGTEQGKMKFSFSQEIGSSPVFCN